MPQLNELLLTVRGSRRSARFFVTGIIDYDDSDISRNGTYLNVNFYGQDGPNREIIRGRQLWSTRGRVTIDSEGLDTWNFTAISPIRTRFEVSFGNENSRPARRSFNEDRPGSDEIFCWVQLRDADGTVLTVGQNSNVVSGHF